jgi:hypothetical protein
MKLALVQELVLVSAAKSCTPQLALRVEARLRNLLQNARDCILGL